MLLDNLDTPLLILLFFLSFTVLFLVYDHYNNMQALLNEKPILSSDPKSVSSSDKITTATPPDAATDIGVLSYLLYHAMGNRDSKVIDDQPLTIPNAPPLPDVHSQSRSPHKRGSRGGRGGKQAYQPQTREAPPSTLSPSAASSSLSIPPRANQHYDYFLVFDVEATCVQGQDFNWCNEIIVSRP